MERFADWAVGRIHKVMEAAAWLLLLGETISLSLKLKSPSQDENLQGAAYVNKHIQGIQGHRVTHPENHFSDSVRLHEVITVAAIGKRTAAVGKAEQMPNSDFLPPARLPPFLVPGALGRMSGGGIFRVWHPPKGT